MRSLPMMFAALSIGLLGSSCGTSREVEKKPVPPPGSTASKMPWNVPQAGQGMGQFGMLPQQMQQRR